MLQFKSIELYLSSFTLNKSIILICISTKEKIITKIYLIFNENIFYYIDKTYIILKSDDFPHIISDIH